MDERQVEAYGKTFEFPATPNYVSQAQARLHRQRRATWRWLQVTTACLVIGFAALWVLDVEARDLLRIGSVQIFRSKDEARLRPPAIPSTVIDSVLDLPGEITLTQAQSVVDFRINLPTNTPLPDKVYWLRVGGDMIVLVWLDDYGEVAFSLHLMDANVFVGKYYPWEETPVTVRGRPALWLTHVHDYEIFKDGSYDGPILRRKVQGNVLLWTAGGITYRLETTLPLDQARLIAESIDTT